MESLISLLLSMDRVQEKHFHENIELIYVIEGQMYITLGTATTLLGPEDFIVINPNEIHEFHAYEKIFSAIITIDYATAAKCFDHHKLAFDCNSQDHTSRYYDEIRNIIRRLLGYSQSSLKQDLLMTESLGYELLYTLINRFLTEKKDKNNDNALLAGSSTRTHSLLQYITANYKNQLSLTETAKQLYLSPAYLSRYFKQHFGMGFLNFVNNIRLDHACQDLSQTKKNITKIALDNGFPSPAAFIRAFKSAYHMTPSQYREKYSVVSAKTNEPPQEEISVKLSGYLNQNQVVINASKNFDECIINQTISHGTKLHHPWNQMINVGPQNLLLRQDMRSQLLDLKRQCGFKYVRISNIFSDERMLKNSDGYSDYNFNEIDQTLDFLVEHGLRPYIQLCSRASFVYKNLKKVLAYENNFDLIKFISENPQIIDKFVSHLLFRYGRSEVEQWYIEFEGCAVIGDVPGAKTYFDTFRYVYQCFKSKIPDIHVGGPGFSPNYYNQNSEETLIAWKNFGCLPDFISMYLYPYEPQDPDVAENPRLYSRNKDFMRDELHAMKKRLETLSVNVNSLHVSQWNSSISDRSAINDSCQKAAFIMRNMINCESAADMIGYALASDIPSELYDTKQALFGGSGLLSCNGIRKPSYYAYYFLNKLENTLHYKNENVIITSGNDGHIVICCHNYKHYNYKYYFTDEDKIFPEHQKQYYENLRSLEISITLSDLENGIYTKKSETINSMYGNIQHIWEEMDYETNLTPEELNYLKTISQPHITIEKTSVSNHSLQFKVRLEPQEIQCIHIRHYE